MQIPVVDIDADGDLDIIVAGKSGLFLFENLSKRQAAKECRVVPLIPAAGPTANSVMAGSCRKCARESWRRP